MTHTHQIQLPDMICDLLTSCIWNHRLREKLWHRAGDGGVRHRFLQENSLTPQLQLRTIDFLVICPVCLGGMIITVSGSRGTWSLDLHYMTWFRESYVLQDKKTREFKKKCI